MSKKMIGIALMFVGMLIFAFIVTSTQNSITASIQFLSESPWMKLLPYGVSGTLVAMGLRYFFQTSGSQKKFSRISDSIWANKEELTQSLRSLSKKEQLYVQNISWAALVNPFVWAIANRQSMALTLLFVPGVNVIIWFLLFVNGRQIAWLAQVEADAQKYIRREREVLILSLILTCFIVTISLFAQ